MTLPISVFIVTLNEEHNLKRLLPSLNKFDEIIVVDSGSTDNTVELAQSFGAKVVYNEWPGYAKQKQLAMSLCSNEWVFNLDADELIPETLLPEIENAIKTNECTSVKLARCDYFLGKAMPKQCSLFSNVRLYKKSMASFDETFLVHESADVKGKQLFIKSPFLHFGYNDIDTLCEKLNTYSSLKALEKFQKGKRYSLLKLALILPIEFIRKLALQRFALFGSRGFILSTLYANYAFQKEAKLFELHKTKEK